MRKLWWERQGWKGGRGEWNETFFCWSCAQREEWAWAFVWTTKTAFVIAHSIKGQKNMCENGEQGREEPAKPVEAFLVQHHFTKAHLSSSWTDTHQLVLNSFCLKPGKGRLLLVHFSLGSVISTIFPPQLSSKLLNFHKMWIIANKAVHQTVQDLKSWLMLLHFSCPWSPGMKEHLCHLPPGLDVSCHFLFAQTCDTFLCSARSPAENISNDRFSRPSGQRV